MTEKSTVRVKLVKSLIGRKKNHIRIANTLRLKKINSFADHFVTPGIKGMINKINYLVEVKEL